MQFTLFWPDIFFDGIYSVLLQFMLFCREIYFVSIYALSVWRQIMAKIVSVEKHYKYHVLEV